MPRASMSAQRAGAVSVKSATSRARVPRAKLQMSGAEFK
jgi:hypothetical protein